MTTTGVTTALNRLWTAERALIDQYVARAKVSAARGDNALATQFRRFAMTEMMEVSDLLDRIVAIGGTPELQQVAPVAVGETADEQIAHSLDGERETIAALQDARVASAAAGDEVTTAQLDRYLEEQRAHVDWLQERAAAAAHS